MQGITSKDITELVESAFCLRSCNHDFKKLSKNHRPCLNYHIKRCLAPCAGLCSKEEYAKQIDNVISFLSGNDKKVSALLTEKMTAAAEHEDFELAIFYRKKLEILDKLVRRQVTALPKDFDLDIFAIAANGLNTVVAVLFVRGGKLVGSDKQVVSDLAPESGVVLENFITAYYDKINYIASEVVTATPVDDAELLSEYLSYKKGSKVNVITPHQGVRRQLADMAAGNSSDYLEKSLSLKEREDNTMQKTFDAKQSIITPEGVFMIGTYDENGVPNCMNAAWGQQSDYGEITLFLAKHKTTENIKKTG